MDNAPAPPLCGGGAAPPGAPPRLGYGSPARAGELTGIPVKRIKRGARPGELEGIPVKRIKRGARPGELEGIPVKRIKRGARPGELEGIPVKSFKLLLSRWLLLINLSLGGCFWSIC